MLHEAWHFLSDLLRFDLVLVTGREQTIATAHSLDIGTARAAFYALAYGAGASALALSLPSLFQQVNTEIVAPPKKRGRLGRFVRRHMGRLLSPLHEPLARLVNRLRAVPERWRIPAAVFSAMLPTIGFVSSILIMSPSPYRLRIKALVIGVGSAVGYVSYDLVVVHIFWNNAKRLGVLPSESILTSVAEGVQLAVYALAVYLVLHYWRLLLAVARHLAASAKTRPALVRLAWRRAFARSPA